MLILSDIFFLMGLGFTLAAPLGPVNMEMIKRSLASRFGFFLGIITGVGAMFGDFLVAFSILFVGDEYLRGIIEIPVVYIILLIFNVSFLSYIGISALRVKQESISDFTLNSIETEGSDPSPKTGVMLDDSNPGSLWRAILRQLAIGFVIVVTSPWSYFWWTSFGGFILNSGLPLGTSLERLVVTIYFLSGIFTWVLLFCSILGISQRLASPKILSIITKSSALVIIGFAIKILIDGVDFIIQNIV